MTGLPLITCPACHTEMGLEAILGYDDAREVIEAMVKMPGSAALRKALLRYCGLFAPRKQKLRWSRAASLLRELADMIEAARIERRGRSWPAPVDYWQQALDTLFASPNLNLPLTGHGYLLSIIAGLSDKAEAKAETRTEQRRQGAAGTGGAAERAQRTSMPEHIRENLHQFAQKGTNDDT